MAEENLRNPVGDRAARLAARNLGRNNDQESVQNQNQDEDAGDDVQVRNMSMRDLLDYMDRRYPRVPEVAPVVQFALTPALINPDQPIDYSTSNGAKIFKSSTASLPIKFDLEPKSINTFNEVLKDRCTNAAWDNPGNSIITMQVGARVLNVIDHYGEISLEDVRQECERYIRLPSRRSQHSYQMYECIMNSLTDSARIKITPDADLYTIDGIRCGPLLYRYLMSKAAIDTRVTLSHIRENLSNLDTYMTTIASNITSFNEYVKEQRLNLAARGGVTHDLMTNLWKAYSVASDHDFVQYIRRKKDLYDEGAEMSPDSLMRDAENKYKTLLQEERWNSMSAEQTQIIALSAQIKKLSDDRVKLSGKSKRNRNKNKDAEKSPAKAKSGKGKGKGNKRRGKNKVSEKWAWKRNPPKEGEEDEKIVNDTKYYWCPHHSLWTLTRHTNENCDVLKEKNKDNSSNKKVSNDKKQLPDSASNKSQMPSLSFAAKLQDMMHE